MSPDGIVEVVGVEDLTLRVRPQPNEKSLEPPTTGLGLAKEE